jgi:hypothetical protein
MFAAVFGAITILPFTVVQLIAIPKPTAVEGFWQTAALALALIFAIPFVAALLSAVNPPQLVFEKAYLRIKGVGGNLDLPFSKMQSITVDIDTSRGRPSPWLVVTLNEDEPIPRKGFFFPAPTPSGSIEGGVKVFPLQWLSVPPAEVDAFGRRFLPDLWDQEPS